MDAFDRGGKRKQHAERGVSTHGFVVNERLFDGFDDIEFRRRDGVDLHRGGDLLETEEAR